METTTEPKKTYAKIRKKKVPDETNKNVPDIQGQIARTMQKKLTTTCNTGATVCIMGRNTLDELRINKTSL